MNGQTFSQQFLQVRKKPPPHSTVSPATLAAGLFGDFSHGVCHVMNITVAESYSHMRPVTQ